MSTKIKYKLIGKYIDNGHEKDVYLIYARNCVYLTDEIVTVDKAYDYGDRWFITEQSAIEFCINTYEGFQRIEFYKTKNEEFGK